MVNVSKFIKDHTPLCVCTLGIAILGYLGYHAVRWIINKCHKTEKIDRVAQKNISIASKIDSPSSNNTHTIPRQDPLPHISSDSNPLGDKVQVDEIPLKQETERQKNFAATKIQSAYRGHVARLALKKLQAEKLEGQKSAATIKIQSVFRRYLDRLTVKKEKRHLLSYSLFERAKPFIDEPEKRKDLPTAASGRTRVYLPDGLPIVLKLSGSPQNKTRFDKMRQAREICDESNYSQLVIPTARIHGNFIIESRLPIMKDPDMKVQIGFYLDHVEQLTEAVEEFTGFLCQAGLYDITGGTLHAYSTLSKVPIGRYDNVAMYLEKGIGKLGLIDLESFYPKSKSEQREGFFACREAIRLFPHHLDVIIHAAKRFDSNIENHRKALEEERDCVLEYFKKAYQDHLDFVKQKNIDLTDPVKFADISQSRKEKIREAIEVVIQKENKDIWFKNCLGESPDVTMKLFSEVAFPEILDAILKFIRDLLEAHLEYNGGRALISSYSKLISARTLEFSYHSHIYGDLKKLIASKLDMLVFTFKHKKNGFTSEIIDAILKELENGKEIAYYNPSFGIGGHATHCIFC